MNPKLFVLVPVLALAGVALFLPCSAPAGDVTSASGYKVLEPIRHGNLTVFPVVTARSHDTRGLHYAGRRTTLWRCNRHRVR